MQTYEIIRRGARQRGFSLVAGFIVIAVMMSVVAYFLAGQGVNTTSTSSVTNSARGAAIITQGAFLKSGFDLMTLGGNAAVDTITFDSTATTGLFNGVTGGAQPQSPDPTTLVAPRTGANGIWLYKKGSLQVAGVGTGGFHYAVILSGLTKGACEQVNQILRGTIAIPDSNLTQSAWVGAATTAAPTDSTQTAVSNATGLDKACVSTTDTPKMYVYYQVVYPV